MRRQLHKDVQAGVVVALIGGGFAARSAHYRIGSLLQMGPGFFPAALGIVFALAGIAIAIQGYLKSPAESRALRLPEWRVWFLIVAAVLAFIVLGGRLGLAAASFAIVFISAFADRKNTWRSAILLAVVMTVVSTLVFWWGLKLQFPLWQWGDA